MPNIEHNADESRHAIGAGPRPRETRRPGAGTGAGASVGAGANAGESSAGTATPAAATSPQAVPSAPSRTDYARFARMADESLLRDCEVWAFRATGPGGQGVNTTDSAVRLRHTPTGITVVSRESRSQLQNKLNCLRKLRVVFESRAKPPTKRKPTHVSAAQKQRRLDAKHRASEKKAARKKPRRLDDE